MQIPKITNNSNHVSKLSTTSGKISGSLLEQAAVMIALDEGFSAEPYDFGVGKYGHSAGYGTYIGEFSPSQFPLSPESAWDVLLKVLENNYIPYCDKYIEQYLGDISDCQKCAIYTFANFLLPALIYDRRHRSWLTYTTNTFVLQTSNISELPSNIQFLATQMSNNN